MTGSRNNTAANPHQQVTVTGSRNNTAANPHQQVTVAGVRLTSVSGAGRRPAG